MKVKMLGILGVFLLVAALVVGLAGVALAGDENSTKWLLDSEQTGANFRMERDGGPGDDGQSGGVPVAGGGSTLWIADEAAAVTLGFSTADWAVALYRSPGAAPVYDVIVDIGVWDGSSFTSKGTSTTKTFPSGVYNVSFSYSVSAFTVPGDDWIAFQVTSQEVDGFTMSTAGGSSIRYPPDDPAYPVPELATIVLSSVGLAAVGGYVWLRRRGHTAQPA